MIGLNIITLLAFYVTLVASACINHTEPASPATNDVQEGQGQRDLRKTSLPPDCNWLTTHGRQVQDGMVLDWATLPFLWDTLYTTRPVFMTLTFFQKVILNTIWQCQYRAFSTHFTWEIKPVYWQEVWPTIWDLAECLSKEIACSFSSMVQHIWNKFK